MVGTKSIGVSMGAGAVDSLLGQGLLGGAAAIGVGVAGGMANTQAIGGFVTGQRLAGQVEGGLGSLFDELGGGSA